jgi:hypothetical protein
MKPRLPVLARVLACTALASVVCAIGPTAPARASEVEPAPPTAREWYEEGTRRHKAGAYKAAIDAYRHAYDLDHDPVYLYDIALAWAQLGNATEAVRGYEAYLFADPETPLRADVEKEIARLKAAPAGAPPTALMPSLTVPPGPAPAAATAPAPAPARRSRTPLLVAGVASAVMVVVTITAVAIAVRRPAIDRFLDGFQGVTLDFTTP